MRTMLGKLQLGCMFATLLLLGACGGGPAVPDGSVPDAPVKVFVSQGTIPTIIYWRHDGSNTVEYVVYREPSNGSSTRTEIARLPVGDEDQIIYLYRDAELVETAATSDNEPSVRYSVAAVGTEGMSEATPQAESSNIGATDSCVIQKKSRSDSDGDGIPNHQERTVWQILVAPPTASATGVEDQLQRDKSIPRSVKSNPHNPDTDGDGICDLHEHGQAGTDPANADTDGDFLRDFAEVVTWNSNAKDPDSDDDAFAPVIKLENGQQEVAFVTLASGNQALYDGREVCSDGSFPCNFKTSPTLADTDGDSYTDYDEIIEQGTDFNPLIANLPQLELSLVGTADLYVNIGYTNSSKEAEKKSTSLSKSTSSKNTNYTSDVRKTWHEYGQSVTTSASYGPKGFSGSVKATASFKEGSSTTNTNGWSGTTAQSSKDTYDAATETAREQGRDITGGTIGMGVQLKNTGQITYTVTNLTVTALQRDPEDPTSIKTIATLELVDALEKDGVTLGPSKATNTLEVSADLDAGNVILELMANPSSLFFEIGNVTMANDQKVNFNFLDQVTNAQTGLVLIDYGNGDVISKRVATNVARDGGRIAGITLGDVLKTIDIDYNTDTTTIAGATVDVLTGVKDPTTGNFVSVDTSNNTFWVAFKTANSTQPIAQDFDDIVLEAGHAIYLLYVTDQDGDKLYLRDENIYGSSDTNKDSDGDGLSDFAEVVTGWQMPANLPPLGAHQVYSNPTLADADNDGLNDSQEKNAGTDPNSDDTDGDLLCDGSGNSANATGLCAANSTPDPEPLVPRFAFLLDDPNTSPKPYSIATAPKDNTISATFTIPVKATSSFGVRSNLRGPLWGGSFSFSNGGRTITFTPKNGGWWLPGEVLTVSLEGISAESTGKPLPVYQYSFRAATNAGILGDQPAFYQSYDEHVALNPNYDVWEIVSADFNQDAVLDLAVLGGLRGDNPQNAEVTVLLSVDDAWQGETSYPLNFVDAQGLISGDFNNDGRLDLAVGMQDNNEVAVLLAGSTQGTFDNAVYYPTGKYVWSLAAADFNGDGNLDLVTTNNEDTNQNGNSVLLGNGNGTFKPWAPAPSGPHPLGVATGDVNGDGIPDIITTFSGNSDWKQGVFVNLGNGDGTFRQSGKPQPFTAQKQPVAIATGDFNRDGWLDVVTANDSNDVSLLLNDGKGDGLFTPQPNISLGAVGSLFDVITADFNGDGYLDIVTADDTPDALATILSGTETVGTFNNSYIQSDGTLTTLGLAATIALGNENPLSLVVVGDSSTGKQLAFIKGIPK